MPHNGSPIAGAAYVNGTYNGRELINRFDAGHSWSDEQTGVDIPQSYLDGNGTILSAPPGAGNAWQTNNLWIYGATGQIWVFTFTGTCTPVIWAGKFLGPGSWREALPAELPPGTPAAGPNRKYYIVQGTGVATKDSLVNPDTALTVDGVGGTNGWAYLVRIWLRNQVGPVGNLKFYRLEDEARIQAGERISSEWEQAATGMGSLRFMDMNQSNGFPAMADWGQFPTNPDIMPCLAKYPVSVTATLLSENYYEITPRADTPVASEGMVLEFRYPIEPSYAMCTMYTTGSTSPAGVVPAGKTYFRVEQKVRGIHTGSPYVTDVPESPNHNWTTGDPVSQVSNRWYDTDHTWGIPVDRGPLSCVATITVIDSRTFSIDWDSTGQLNLRKVSFCRSMRIKYGTQTFFMGYNGDGLAKQPWYDGYTGRVFEKINCTVILLTPPGRTFGELWSTMVFEETGSAQQSFHPKIYVDLCNKLKAHAWLCISPFMREDAFLQLCDYWLDHADPELNLQIELGNEIGWNYTWLSVPLQWQAQKGAFTTALGNTVSGSYWGDALGHHCRRLFKLGKQQFALRGAAGRFKGVFGTQWANFGGFTGALDNGSTNDKWWAVGDRALDYTDYIAVAPYYAPPWHYMPNESYGREEWTSGGYFPNGRPSSVTFPGLLEAVWKWKQGGALREEAYEFMRYWTVARTTAVPQTGRPAGTEPWGQWSQSVSDFFDLGYTMSGGAYQSGTLDKDGIWGQRVTQLGKELVLYEWNLDFFASASSEGWPNLFGNGPPSAALLAGTQTGWSFTVPPHGYYDRTNKNYYRATNSGWQLLISNVECTYNGQDISRKDYANFWMQYMWSNARGQEVREFTERFFAANPKNKLPHAFVLNNPGNYRQSFTFWPTRTLDAFDTVPPVIAEYRSFSSAATNILYPGAFATVGNPVTLTYTPAQVQPYYAMTKFNVFTSDLGAGIHNFTSHTFKVALSNSAPTTTWTQLSQVTQIGATGGYPSGGYALTVSWSEAGGLGKLSIEDKQITSNADGMTFRYAIVYNDTSTNDNLIGFYDFGSITMNTSDVLNINFDEAAGALTVQ